MKAIQFIDVAELVKKNPRPPRTKHVHIDWQTFEIVVKGPYEYRYDLERLTNSAEVLDCIYQIGTKTWCNAGLTKDLIMCLEYACDRQFNTQIQGAFCPSGETGWNVNWRTKKRWRS